MSSESPPLRVQRLRPAYEQVADQLRQLILVGDLKPGDQLPVESKLCEIFGVSRSTVREAVRVLAAQDLVRTTRGVTGGSFVAAVEQGAVERYLETRLSLMSVSDVLSVDHLLEARELLEVPATRLAARRATPEQLAQLRAAASTARESRMQDHPERRRFHEVLVGLSHNPLVAVMSVPTFQVLQARFRRADRDDRYWADVDHDHERIVELLEARDEDGAAELMHEHLARLRSLYIDPGP